MYVFAFKTQQRVLICGFNGKFIRCNPDQLDEVDEHGDSSSLAVWNVSFDKSDKKVIRLENAKTKKYLRAVNGGLDCRGTGGMDCSFKFVKGKSGLIALESVVTPDQWISVFPQGIATGKLSEFAHLSVWGEKEHVKNIVKAMLWQS